jgi:hypothetical protein
MTSRELPRLPGKVPGRYVAPSPTAGPHRSSRIWQLEPKGTSGTAAGVNGALSRSKATIWLVAASPARRIQAAALMAHPGAAPVPETSAVEDGLARPRRDAFTRRDHESVENDDTNKVSLAAMLTARHDPSRFGGW